VLFASIVQKSRGQIGRSSDLPNEARSIRGATKCGGADPGTRQQQHGDDGATGKDLALIKLRADCPGATAEDASAYAEQLLTCPLRNTPIATRPLPALIRRSTSLLTLARVSGRHSKLSRASIFPKGFGWRGDCAQSGVRKDSSREGQYRRAS